MRSTGRRGVCDGHVQIGEDRRKTMVDTDGDGDQHSIYARDGCTLSIRVVDGASVFGTGNAFEYVITDHSQWHDRSIAKDNTPPCLDIFVTHLSPSHKKILKKQMLSEACTP